MCVCVCVCVCVCLCVNRFNACLKNSGTGITSDIIQFQISNYIVFPAK